MKFKILLIIFPLFLLTVTNSQTCQSNLQINDTNCFNDLIIFNLEDKYYRAGHFAMNTKGDMIIEYSYLQYRLFYGLKKDGKLYYPEIIKEIEIANDTVASDSIRRYESINLFVSAVNDCNKTKEYLMSLSSWITILELYDLENNDYNVFESVSFFDNPKGTYSYVFQVLEAKFNNSIIYFGIYLYHVGDESRVILEIKKFIVSDFNTAPIEVKKTGGINTILMRITSAVIFNNSNTLAIFFLPYGDDPTHYHTNFYDFDLNQKGELSFQETVNANSMLGNGLFFKSIILYDNYAAFLYFFSEYNYYLRILNFNENSYSFDCGLCFMDNEFVLYPLLTLNDFIKINNNRLALITTQQACSELLIILYDFYNNYELLKIRL